jgi:NADH:ubiquinone oxidoreductase subunit 2 (subunit N)
MIGLIGLLTAVMAAGVTRVQSSIKSKVAYASMAQIGLMFIELAFGLVDLALIHFAGNAFLRTYQLLVSPSVVTYLIREQFYSFTPRHRAVADSFLKRIEYSLYVLCLKEWNLDSLMYRYLWNPVKWAGKKIKFLSVVWVFLFFVPVYVLGLFGVYNKQLIPFAIQGQLPFIFAIIALMMVLKAFSERINVWLSWILVSMSHFWVVLAVAFNENFSFDHVHIYLSGVAPSATLGLLCLYRLKMLEGNISLNQFRGYSYHHRTLAFAFLMACLGLAGFPITPTFIGEDLIFSHIHENQVALASCIALCFIISGLALVRIYARVFMGPRVKSIYETAYRSS